MGPIAAGTAHVYFLIYDEPDATILLFPSEGGWSVPSVHYDQARVDTLKTCRDLENILREKACIESTAPSPACIFLYHAYYKRVVKNATKVLRSVNVVEIDILPEPQMELDGSQELS